jgi:hypothetical protein
MRLTSFQWMKVGRVALAVISMTLGALGPLSSFAADTPPRSKQRPLRISLFSYVLDQKLIQDTILKR